MRKNRQKIEEKKMKKNWEIHIQRKNSKKAIEKKIEENKWNQIGNNQRKRTENWRKMIIPGTKN